MMKKYLLFPVFFTVLLSIHAQDPGALIKTEKAFEDSCLKKGIRDGFLDFVDSNGIVMTKEGIANARQFWNTLPSFDGVFTWSPAYAEMSISGDWGFTTGNYEHRPKTLTDPVNEFGQYTTIWHRIGDGKWKYLFDIGNVHPPATLDKQAKTISVKKYSSENKTPAFIPDGPEKEFISSFEKNIKNAYQQYAGIKYMLNLTGHQLITSRDSAVMGLNKIQPSLKCHSAGLFVSPGRDMFAVYGNLGEVHTGGEYLRIWRHEKEGWKIAMEVIKN